MIDRPTSVFDMGHGPVDRPWVMTAAYTES